MTQIIDLVDARTRHHVLVQQMAADLIRFEALGPEMDSILSLYGTRRYSSSDICRFVGEARAVAFQEMKVAEAMSDV